MTERVEDAFRVLVVDDEKPIFDVIQSHLGFCGDAIRLDYAATADEAQGFLAERLYDLALLDIYGQDDLLIGLEVYRRIDAANLATRVLLMTQYTLKEDAVRLLELTGSPSAWRIAGFLDKRHQFGTAVKARVGSQLAHFANSRATIDGLDEVAKLIKRQRHRYRDQTGVITLRSNVGEISTEVDRLIRKLYGELPGGTDRESTVSVALAPMQRRGLSAAVVVNATVTVDFARIKGEVGGHKTVLKVGPKSDILAEASRFFEYVRYGVELAQRVELLGVAAGDSLAGLVYSFAGGLYDHDPLPLDEALIEDLQSTDLAFSVGVLSKLFSSRSWYSVTSEPQDVGDYFTNNYKTDLGRSSREGEKQLDQLLKKCGDGGPRIDRLDTKRGGLQLTTSSGVSMVLPDASVLGWGHLLHKSPTCLVHGDMHGGNVLVESSLESPAGPTPKRKHLRTCLIDFRNAGPGPRCIDAVSLESSIRYADAEMASRELPLVGRRSTPDVTPAVANELLERVSEEKALYRAVFLHQGSVPETAWAELAATVLEGLFGCFPDMTLREYLATSVRYTIRSLGFSINDAARYRLVSWLAAQYELAREIERLT